MSFSLLFFLSPSCCPFFLIFQRTLAFLVCAQQQHSRSVASVPIFLDTVRARTCIFEPIVSADEGSTTTTTTITAAAVTARTTTTATTTTTAATAWTPAAPFHPIGKMRREFEGADPDPRQEKEKIWRPGMSDIFGDNLVETVTFLSCVCKTVKHNRLKQKFKSSWKSKKTFFIWNNSFKSSLSTVLAGSWFGLLGELGNKYF